MKAIAALVSDLDGTLLNRVHCVPEQYESLRKVLDDRGIAFFVASARPLGNIRKLFEGRVAPAGIIACDGAITASLRYGVITQYAENTLAKDVARRAVCVMRDSGLHPIVFLTRQHDFTVVVCPQEPYALKGVLESDRTRPTAIMDVADIEDILDSVAVRAVSAFGERHLIGSATHAIEEAMANIDGMRAYNYLESRFGNNELAWLDVVSAVTKKEDAVEVLFGMKGLAGKPFVACGNGENDRAMLAKASSAFCPHNAVPSVQMICGHGWSPHLEGEGFVGWLIDRLGE